MHIQQHGPIVAVDSPIAIKTATQIHMHKDSSMAPNTHTRTHTDTHTHRRRHTVPHTHSPTHTHSHTQTPWVD